MKSIHLYRFVMPVAISGVLLVCGCNSKPANNEQPQQAATQPQQPPAGQMQAPPANNAQQSAMAGPPQAPPNAAQQSAMAGPPPAPASSSSMAEPPRAAMPVSTTIPAGTRISVRIGQTIDSKTATEGQPFSGTVATPVTVRGRTVIRAGSAASGTVVATKSRGRFKGEGFLQLRLDSVRADSRTYQVETSTVERVEQGKGKRTAVFAGGGGGLGALIGGLAGGGKGALIGGLAGAGAGTAGTAFTGNKPITVPAETVLTFRLTNSVTVR